MADSHRKKIQNRPPTSTLPVSPSYNTSPRIVVSPPPLATPSPKDSLPSSSLEASSTTTTTDITTSVPLATLRQSGTAVSSASTETLTTSSLPSVSNVKQHLSASSFGADDYVQTKTGTTQKPVAKPTSLRLYHPLENGGIGYSLKAAKHFREMEKKAHKMDKEDINLKFKQKAKRWYSADHEPEYMIENETRGLNQYKTEFKRNKGIFNKSSSLEETHLKRVLSRRGAFKFDKSKLKGDSLERDNTRKEKEKVRRSISTDNNHDDDADRDNDDNKKSSSSCMPGSGKRKKINRYIGHLGSSNEASDESDGLEASGRQQKGAFKRLSNSFNLGLLGLGLGTTRSSQKDEKKKKFGKKKKEENENSWYFKRRKPKRSKSEGSNSSDGTDTDESSVTSSESGYQKRTKGGIDQDIRNTAIRSVTEMISAIQAIELPTVTPFDKRKEVNKSKSSSAKAESWDDVGCSNFEEVSLYARYYQEEHDCRNSNNSIESTVRYKVQDPEYKRTSLKEQRQTITSELLLPKTKHLKTPPPIRSITDVGQFHNLVISRDKLITDPVFSKSSSLPNPQVSSPSYALTYVQEDSKSNKLDSVLPVTQTSQALTSTVTEQTFYTKYNLSSSTESSLNSLNVTSSQSLIATFPNGRVMTNREKDIVEKENEKLDFHGETLESRKRFQMKYRSEFRNDETQDKWFENQEKKSDETEKQSEKQQDQQNSKFFQQNNKPSRIPILTQRSSSAEGFYRNKRIDLKKLMSIGASVSRSGDRHTNIFPSQTKTDEAMERQASMDLPVYTNATTACKGTSLTTNTTVVSSVPKNVLPLSENNIIKSITSTSTISTDTTISVADNSYTKDQVSPLTDLVVSSVNRSNRASVGINLNSKDSASAINVSVSSRSAGTGGGKCHYYDGSSNSCQQSVDRTYMLIHRSQSGDDSLCKAAFLHASNDSDGRSDVSIVDSSTVDLHGAIDVVGGGSYAQAETVATATKPARGAERRENKSVEGNRNVIPKQYGQTSARTQLYQPPLVTNVTTQQTIGGGYQQTIKKRQQQKYQQKQLILQQNTSCLRESASTNKELVSSCNKGEDGVYFEPVISNIVEIKQQGNVTSINNRTFNISNNGADWERQQAARSITSTAGIDTMEQSWNFDSGQNLSSTQETGDIRDHRYTSPELRKTKNNHNEDTFQHNQLDQGNRKKAEPSNYPLVCTVYTASGLETIPIYPYYISSSTDRGDTNYQDNYTSSNHFSVADSKHSDSLKKAVTEASSQTEITSPTVSQGASVISTAGTTSSRAVTGLAATALATTTLTTATSARRAKACDDNKGKLQETIQPCSSKIYITTNQGDAHYSNRTEYPVFHPNNSSIYLPTTVACSSSQNFNNDSRPIIQVDESQDLSYAWNTTALETDRTKDCSRTIPNTIFPKSAAKGNLTARSKQRINSTHLQHSQAPLMTPNYQNYSNIYTHPPPTPYHPPPLPPPSSQQACAYCSHQCLQPFLPPPPQSCLMFNNVDTNTFNAPFFNTTTTVVAATNTITTSTTTLSAGDLLKTNCQILTGDDRSSSLSNRGRRMNISNNNNNNNNNNPNRFCNDNWQSADSDSKKMSSSRKPLRRTRVMDPPVNFNNRRDRSFGFLSFRLGGTEKNFR